MVVTYSFSLENLHEKLLSINSVKSLLIIEISINTYYSQHIDFYKHFLIEILDADASGKPGSGFFAGNLVWLGSYATCQNITDAQYCLAPSVTIQIKDLVSD